MRPPPTTRHGVCAPQPPVGPPCRGGQGPGRGAGGSAAALEGEGEPQATASCGLQHPAASCQGGSSAGGGGQRKWGCPPPPPALRLGKLRHGVAGVRAAQRGRLPCAKGGAGVKDSSCPRGCGGGGGGGTRSHPAHGTGSSALQVEARHSHRAGQREQGSATAIAEVCGAPLPRVSPEQCRGSRSRGSVACSGSGASCGLGGARGHPGARHGPGGAAAGRALGRGPGTPDPPRLAP